MKKTFAVINQMQADGIIGRYAIGGAVAATFYLEPFATLDINIFVALKPTPNSILLSISPVYEYLSQRGYHTEGEYIVIEGWNVQFLPPGSPLEEEALNEANQTNIDSQNVWVMSAEHLVAIALKLGRSKDYVRILMFIESGTVDTGKLDAILARHHLIEKWNNFGDKFLRQQ